MRITDIAITKIKESESCKREITYQIEISYNTLYRWLNENRANGPLTTHKAVDIIAEETGLLEDEILITDNVEA